MVPHRAYTVPPQWDIEVVFEPGGEGDVPASPKLADRGGTIGVVEVDHHAEPEDTSAAQGDIGVSRKVTVDLIGKEDGGEGELQAIVVLRGAVDVIDVQRETIRDHQLLEEAPAHLFQSRRDGAVLQVVAFVELVEQVLRTFDWTGHELGKEHHVRRIRDEVLLRLLLAPIDFNHIAQTLKGVEREPDRQDDLERRILQLPPEEPDHVDEGVGEEVEVLEDKQNQTGGDDADPQQELFVSWLNALKIDAGEVVDQDRDEQDRDIDRDECHVEHATGDKQQQRAVPMRQDEIQRTNGWEKDGELDGVEKHGKGNFPVCVM